MDYITFFGLNPGLQHLAIEILKRLDSKSLRECTSVSRNWEEIIDCLMKPLIQKDIQQTVKTFEIEDFWWDDFFTYLKFYLEKWYCPFNDSKQG